MGEFVDISKKAALSMNGPDCLDFLQRISTNNVLSLGEGQWVQTILTNEKGRIVDVVTVVNRSSNGVLLLGESERSNQLQSWIEKYIIMEDIQIEDVTANCAQLLIYGHENSPRGSLSGLLTEKSLMVDELWKDCRMSRILVESVTKEAIKTELTKSGFLLSTSERYEEFRIQHGIPASPNELSVSYNPLEAGLGHLISWTKGCYIGQEVIARLDTYKKVQRVLVRLQMEELPRTLPAPILVDDSECGTITSARRDSESGGCVGLGYLRTGVQMNEANFFFVLDGRKVTVIVES